MMKEAKWTTGKSTLTGRWEYYRPSDCFIVHLDKRDSVTGEPRRFKVYGDKPEWRNWKLVK